MAKPAGDEHLGKFVYCGQHLNPHETGWCTVDVMDKLPLRAQTQEDAVAECRHFGLKLYGDR